MAKLTTMLVAFGAVAALLALLGFGLVKGSSATEVAAAGRQASNFELAGFDGSVQRLSDHGGKVVVVNFWAAWCQPCRDEQATLERVWQAYRGRGVVLLGVNVWDKESAARAHLAEFGVTYPNGRSPNGDVAVEYGITGLPETYIVSPNGRILRKHVGPVTDERLSSWLDEALTAGS
ncbi:MAG: TlpA family protein disulfide reductase [Chloroflexi bacterium]|nr:TlpA family protein disulfide reductase [Chloroflexota bacterium]